MPGQFGPTRRVVDRSIIARTRIMSMTGMPSVMQTTNSSPASTASNIESPAYAGGTKITETVAPVARTAAETVSKTGTLALPCSKIWPPLVGVTPATIWVP